MVYSHLSEHVFCTQGCCCNGNILSVVSIHVHILCCFDEVRRSVRNIRSQLYPDDAYLWPNGTIGYIYSSSLCKSTNTVVAQGMSYQTHFDFRLLMAQQFIHNIN